MSFPSRFSVLSGFSAPGSAGSGICFTQTAMFMTDDVAIRPVIPTKSCGLRSARMTASGTATYDGVEDLPPLVARAVALARELGFDLSSIPEQGRLLQVLARGARGGRIGETGTGAGVGVAWLAS